MVVGGGTNGVLDADDVVAGGAVEVIGFVVGAAVVLSMSTGCGVVTSTVVADGFGGGAVVVAVIAVVDVLVVVAVERGQKRHTANAANAPKRRSAMNVIAMMRPVLLRFGAAPGIVAATVGGAGALGGGGGGGE